MANELFTARAVVDHNVSLGAQGQGPPTYLSLEMTTESPAKKATMMSMKCNNVAFIPLFTLFLILGCGARCRWLKAMPDIVHYENICRRLLLALTKCHSSVWSALPRRILPLPSVRIPHQAVSCVADKLGSSRLTSVSRPKKSLRVQRCDASPWRQRKSTPDVAFSFFLGGRCREITAPRSLSRLSRTTEKSVVQDAFTCCHGPEVFWPIVNDRPGRG
ncbi:hypothetical protein CI102_3192 [Trichoderma harzianum]|nr:hypothetical protein CI102_3192 [Trichoderma harzianum]